jgi:hypothetical protein
LGLPHSLFCLTANTETASGSGIFLPEIMVVAAVAVAVAAAVA